jgi:hypothetical protein
LLTSSSDQSSRLADCCVELRVAFSVPTALHREIVVYSAADEETFSRLEQLAAPLDQSGEGGVGSFLPSTGVAPAAALQGRRAWPRQIPPAS